MTGKIATFIAIGNPSRTEKSAALLKISAVLAAWSATGTVRYPDTVALYTMFQSKVLAAYLAVHAAGGNQFFFHFLNLPSINYSTRSILATLFTMAKNE